MTKKILIVIIFITLLNIAFANNEYKLIKIDYPDGKCLDGSLPAIYWKEGTEKNKFILYFEGGGWCGSADGSEAALKDCHGRSKTDLGSSKKYPDSATID